MVVVGSKRMVQYDDTSSDDAVRVYDRGFEFNQPANFGEYQLTYRSGDMVAPRIQAAEPLTLELEDFVTAITTGRRPRSHAHFGLEIVRVLEAANTSLQLHGQPVAVERVGENAAVLNGNGHTNGNPNGNGDDRALHRNALDTPSSGANGRAEAVERTVRA
jgi:hypothetical protein